jgi:hypothetical protein
MNEETK